MVDMIARALALKAGQGGGGSSDAVKYTEQELTTVQQMQARENQGLYYTDGESGVIEWDGVVEGKYVVDVGGMQVVQISDKTPTEELLNGTKATTLYSGHTYEASFEEYEVDPAGLTATAIYCANSGISFELPLNIVFKNNTDLGGGVILEHKGIYIMAAGLSTMTFTIPYGSETVHKIEEKYLPDTTATKEYVDAAIGTAIGGEY